MSIQPRTKLTFFLLLTVSLLPLVGSVDAADEPTAEKAKILLVHTKLDHPWATHMYQLECNLLAHCLVQTPGVEVVQAEDWPDADQLRGVRSIVYYSRPAGDLVLAAEHRDRFQQLMADGVGFAAIHYATGADESRGEEYRKVLGGWFNFAHAGLKVDRQLLVQADGEHPICRGWKAYALHDEFYLNLKFDNQMHPLLKVTVDDKEQVVAWTLEREGSKDGRSFGTTLGHFHENFGIPEFRQLLVNGILWTAHVDVPLAGAPVAATVDLLKLPSEVK